MMRRSRAIRLRAIWVLAGLAGPIGCTHNHYYYTPTGSPLGAGSACDPVTGQPIISSITPIGGTPMLGAVCDDPPLSAQGGSMVARSSPRTTPIVSNGGRPIAPAPVYSQPKGRPAGRSSGLVWRGSNTESMASTRIEGAYD